MNSYNKISYINKIVKEFDKIRDDYEESDCSDYEIAYLKKLRKKVEEVCDCIRSFNNLKKYIQNFLDDKEDGDDSVCKICDRVKFDIIDYLQDKYKVNNDDVICIVNALIDIGKCKQSYYNCYNLLQNNLKTKDPKIILSMCESMTLAEQKIQKVKIYQDECIFW